MATEKINGVYHVGYKGGGGGSGSDPEAVKYTPQTLTDAQKAQARTNIGGASSSELSQVNVAIGNLSNIVGDMQPKVEALTYPAYVVAWDGSSSPVVANIPAGVAVTYDGNSYTGTLAASSSTLDKVYLVSTGTTDNYYRYVTQLNGSTYSWQNIGSTEMDLTDYATEAEVSQLSQKVEGIAPARSGQMIKNGEETTLSAYDGKVVKLYAAHNGSAFSTNAYYNVSYFQVAKRSLIKYKLGSYTLNAAAITVSDSVPASGVAFTEIVKMDANTTGEFEVAAGKYIGCLDYNNVAGYLPAYIKITPKEEVNIFDELDSTNERITKVYGEREAALAPTYFNGVRLVDTMTNQLWGKSTATKIGNFVPSSATESTITLSAEDAACFVNPVIMSCKMSDGSYKNIYFSEASSNVITKLYDFREDIDCQDIVSMESLHDTVNGGAGIHLSPYGYRAMAHTVVDKLNTRQPFSDVFVGGWSAQFCKGSTAYTDPNIRDADGTTICIPVKSGISVGGAVNRCEMRYNATIQGVGPLYRTFYEITQDSPNGATVTFPIDARYPFKGFLRVNCARQPGNNGTASLVIKDKSGNTLATQSIAYYADSYIFDLSDKYYDGVDVVVSLPDASQTKVMITEMTLHETYVKAVQIRPLDSKSVVALLGSSNTQFPGLATANTYCPDDPDNVIVERPDGTEGDGCGYFGKELARASGATVDNWGKSGEQTPYGLEIIQKVFATKRYTHVVFSLFANDINANRPMAETLSNIRQMVEYAKGQGAVPIVIMGYASNTGNGVIRYALMYDDLSQGFDSPYIYTSADLHA